MGPYHIDLTTITIEEFFGTLTTNDLSPGRTILTEEKTVRLAALRDDGIATLADLVDAVRTPTRMAACISRTGLPSHYATILRRQALSWVPSPVALARFPGVPDDLVRLLASHGIKHGLHLYSALAREGSIAALAERYGSERYVTDLARLVSMVDHTRVIGVGPIFADVFVECGLDSLSELASVDPDHLFDRIGPILAARGYRGPEVTRWDVRSCVEYAKRLTE
jgi:hypothetical protein